MRSYMDVPYATYPTGRTLRLNLFVPEGLRGRVPVLIWLDGGGWREAIRKPAAHPWLLATGMAVAMIDYRGRQEISAPASLHDCKAAVRFLRANADQYGLDPDRMGIIGSSAGGHLAALLAVSEGVAELEGEGGNPGVSSRVQAMVDFCGPSDLMRMARPEYRHQYQALYNVTESYLGGPVHERGELGRLMSPLTHVSGKCPPTYIQHIKGDAVVPVIESQELYAALYSAGVDVTLEVLPGATHGWDRAATMEPVTAFLNRVLNLGR
jgi:acetyl esterase/lipase